MYYCVGGCVDTHLEASRYDLVWVELVNTLGGAVVRWAGIGVGLL